MPTPIVTVMPGLIVILVIPNVMIVMYVLSVLSITIISMLLVMLNILVVLIILIIAIKAGYTANMGYPGYGGYMVIMACVCGDNSTTNTIYNTCATYNDCMGCMTTNTGIQSDNRAWGTHRPITRARTDNNGVGGE